MGGAVVVAFIASRIAAGSRASLSGESFHLPTAKSIYARLIVGSALFGMGSGRVGLCPRPAIADIGFPDPKAALFVVCTIVGISVYRLLAAIPAPTRPAEAALDG